MPDITELQQASSYRLLYISYLTTDALAEAIGELEKTLWTKPRLLTNERRRLLNDIRRDLYKELGKRQLTLVDPENGLDS